MHFLFCGPYRFIALTLIFLQVVSTYAGEENTLAIDELAGGYVVAAASLGDRAMVTMLSPFPKTYLFDFGLKSFTEIKDGRIRAATRILASEQGFLLFSRSFSASAPLVVLDRDGQFKRSIRIDDIPGIQEISPSQFWRDGDSILLTYETMERDKVWLGRLNLEDQNLKTIGSYATSDKHPSAFWVKVHEDVWWVSPHTGYIAGVDGAYQPAHPITMAENKQVIKRRKHGLNYPDHPMFKYSTIVKVFIHLGDGLSYSHQTKTEEDIVRMVLGNKITTKKVLWNYYVLDRRGLHETTAQVIARHKGEALCFDWEEEGFTIQRDSP